MLGVCFFFSFSTHTHTHIARPSLLASEVIIRALWLYLLCKVFLPSLPSVDRQANFMSVMSVSSRLSGPSGLRDLTKLLHETLD